MMSIDASNLQNPASTWGVAHLPAEALLAAQQRVSRFTVVEAYDRLVASGHVESRRGSGFYVSAAAMPDSAAPRTV